MGGVLMFRSERMRRTCARSTASGTSSHMQSWADCITGTHVSSFWKRQAYYNQERTHLALQKDAPLHRAIQRSGAVVAIPILAGLHHQYVRVWFSERTPVDDVDFDGRMDSIKEREN